MRIKKFNEEINSFDFQEDFEEDEPRREKPLAINNFNRRITISELKNYIDDLPSDTEINMYSSSMDSFVNFSVSISRNMALRKNELIFTAY